MKWRCLEILDLCYMYIEDYENLKPKVVVLWPYEFNKEPILKENVNHIREYIYDYIDAENEYKSYKNMKQQVIFDIDKDKCQSHIDFAQKTMDELSEKMNKNISPYCWIIRKGINTRIDRVDIKADYGCFLEKI